VAALVDSDDALNHAVEDCCHLRAFAFQVLDFIAEPLGHEVERPA
jgi:hypothetical protein